MTARASPGRWSGRRFTSCSSPTPISTEHREVRPASARLGRAARAARGVAPITPPRSPRSTWCRSALPAAPHLSFDRLDRAGAALVKASRSSDWPTSPLSRSPPSRRARRPRRWPPRSGAASRAFRLRLLPTSCPAGLPGPPAPRDGLDRELSLRGNGPALSVELQPHFLFNTLTRSPSWFSRSATAESMLVT